MRIGGRCGLVEVGVVKEEEGGAEESLGSQGRRWRKEAGACVQRRKEARVCLRRRKEAGVLQRSGAGCSA